jgi:hypothetical protein
LRCKSRPSGGGCLAEIVENGQDLGLTGVPGRKMSLSRVPTQISPGDPIKVFSLMKLNSDSYAAFVRSGWVCLRGLLSLKERRLLRSWADEIQASPAEECLKYHEISAGGEKILSRVENFIELKYPLEFPIRSSSALVGLVSMLLGDEPLLFKDKINLKPPGSGAYAVHQDGPAYQGFGISSFITAMVAVDDATESNGCLEVATGSRTMRELQLDDQGQIIASELKGIEFRSLPLKSGDVVFFDGLLPHRSACNDSDSPRRAVFLTFNAKKDGDRRAAYYETKKKLFPPEDQRLASLDYRKIGKQFNLGNPFI